MGQSIDPEELREMLRVARKLRVSAETTQDASYVHLFLRGAIALEERAAHLARHPSDLEMPELTPEDAERDAALHRHVDFLC